MKNRQIPRRLSAFLVDQDGAMAIVIAVLFPLLMGFAGLAVDIGHMYVVKTQLQNAADAGALSGARALVPYSGSPSSPDWPTGRDKATLSVKRNHADNVPLTDCKVEYGYWNSTTNTLPLQSSGIAPTANDFPAVQVTVAKTAEKKSAAEDGGTPAQNGGPVQMFLASVLGVLPAEASATSVAMISFPIGVQPGGLKPLVATTTIVDNYWNRNDPDHPGLPFQFKLGDGKQADDTMWTTFKVESNSDAYTKELILNGNPEAIYIGDSIYLQPGVRAVDYGPNEMGKFVNTTVVLPVVDPVTLVEKTSAPILDFIAFHITGYSQGGQYIEGYFDKTYIITNPQGAGQPHNPYSTSNPPQLVF